MADDGYIPKQTCWTCKHFYFSAATPHYSQMTPGYATEMECRKGQWKEPLDSEQEFASAMEFGFTCSLYEKDNWT